MLPRIIIENALVYTPGGSCGKRAVAIDEGVFADASADAPKPRIPPVPVDCRGLVAFPGLINAHDHLVGSWSPKAGGKIYENVYQWLDEYVDGPVRGERLNLPDILAVHLGAYRNLFSGVTSVVEHFARPDAVLSTAYATAPVRVITDFGREWVMRSRTQPDRYKPWGAGIEAEFARTRGLKPFVIHVSEGVDGECRSELRALDSLGALAANSVLVHGVAFDGADVSAVSAAGAAVVWCPCSNVYLYGVSTDVLALTRAGVEIMLGTDSTVTGADDLLTEMRFAREYYSRRHGADIGASRLVGMVTAVPAHRFFKGAGTISPGAPADMVLVPSGSADPAEDLLRARPADIDLVLCRGIPAYGSPRHESLFRSAGRPWSRLKVGGAPKLATGDPVGLLREIRTRLGKEKRFHFIDIS